MLRCRWNSSIHSSLNFFRLLLFKALITYILFISPSAAATLAIVYPEVPAPYKQVFEQIIEGIEARHAGPLVKYPIASPVDPDKLLGQMSNDQVDMVVTLGRRGLSYNKALKGQYPLVTGALPIKPNGISGVSLIANPNNLFRQLLVLSPKTRKVHAVYTQKSQWLIDKAQKAAQANGLELISYKASDIREAVKHYQNIFKNADPVEDSIWLPLDSIAANEKVILPLLVRESWDNNLVVFSSKPGHVKRGLLFTLFPDSTEDGVRLADMLNTIYHEGKNPGVELSNSAKVGVNMRTASHLGLEYSPLMKKSFYQTFPQSGF
ncbi:MAG: ABC transporter substrate binding protein [Neptuniibacter sp.]